MGIVIFSLFFKLTHQRTIVSKIIRKSYSITHIKKVALFLRNEIYKVWKLTSLKVFQVPKLDQKFLKLVRLFYLFKCYIKILSYLNYFLKLQCFLFSVYNIIQIIFNKNFNSSFISGQSPIIRRITCKDWQFRYSHKSSQ